MVPVVDVEFPVVEKKPVTDWSNFEALVPRPSVSIAGIYLEMRGRPSAPIIRHVMRREGTEKQASLHRGPQEQQLST